MRDAVAAYRNPGRRIRARPGARRPRLRAASRSPSSQALRILHEADAWSGELAAAACDWLQATAPAEGGAVFVDPSIEGWPHAPWWVPEEGRPASLIITGLIAGTLHARGVRHPWLDRATEVMWSRIDGLSEAGPYDLRGVLRFLDHVPDRARAAHALEQASASCCSSWTWSRWTRTRPARCTGRSTTRPPPGLASSLFDDAMIDAHLDHLARAQRDDGGWTFNWMAWSPAAEQEWRGCAP